MRARWFLLLLVPVLVLAVVLLLDGDGPGAGVRPVVVDPGAGAVRADSALEPAEGVSGGVDPASAVRRADAASSADATPAGEGPSPLEPVRLEVLDARTREPVEGARALLGGAGPVATDRAGRASVAWSGAVPRLHLAVEHPGYVDRRGLVVGPGDEVRVELVASATLTGEVLGPERPARLLLWARDDGRPDDEARREVELPEARFEVSDLDPGEYTVALVGPDVPFEAQGGLWLPPGGTVHVELGPLDPRPLTVRVVLRGPTPRDLPGARVRIEPEVDGIPARVEELAAREAVSGEDGRARFEHLAPGRLRLQVRAPWGAEERQTVDLAPSAWGPAGEGAEEIEVRFPDPGRLAGVVRHGDGRPAPGAEVWLFEPARGDRRVRLAEGEVVARANAGEDGRFLLEAVPSTRPLMLAARAAGGGPVAFAWRSPRHVPPGSLRSDFEVVLEEGGRIEGTVLDDQDRPVPGVAVQLELPVGGTHVEWCELVSDGEGRVAVDGAPPGRVRAYLRDPRVEPTAEGLDVEPGGVTRFEWRLEVRHAVDCRVVDRDGFAVAGARVVARRPPGAERGGRRASEPSDELGLARVEGLEAGPWLLEAAARGWRGVGPPPAVEVPGAAAVLLELEAEEPPEPVVLRGEVVRVGDGSPVPGLEIGGARGGLLRLDGTRFEVSGVRPGRLRLHVGAEGYTLHAYPPVDAAPGTVVELEPVGLRAAGEVELRLVEPGGGALRGAEVALVHPGEGVLRLRERGRGVYRRSHVPRRGYELRVRSGERSWTLPLEVAGRRVRETLELPPPGR